MHKENLYFGKLHLKRNSMKVIITNSIVVSLLVFLFICSCKRNSNLSEEKLLTNNYLSNNYINCDSIYKEKGIYIGIDSLSFESENFNYLLSIYRKNTQNQYIQIYSDTVYSKTTDLKFEDYNGDGVKDILLQNQSDVRSNWTYNLYLANPKDYEFRKVVRFNEIKNPFFNDGYDIISSTVISGKNYTEFFKITKESSICSYDFILYDSDISSSYDEEINSILKELTAMQCK